MLFEILRIAIFFFFSWQNLNEEKDQLMDVTRYSWRLCQNDLSQNFHSIYWYFTLAQLENTSWRYQRDISNVYLIYPLPFFISPFKFYSTFQFLYVDFVLTRRSFLFFSLHILFYFIFFLFQTRLIVFYDSSMTC